MQRNGIHQTPNSQSLVKILHLFDHSIPLHSGYTFRSKAILEAQRKMGWQTVHLTSYKHKIAAGETPEVEEIDGLPFYRTTSINPVLSRLPVFNQWAIINATAKRLNDIVIKERPDLIHAHSPALNGIAALRVGRKHKIPVVYECRAFWEDAAVDHGTTIENGVRYRITRGLETHVFTKADAVCTICNGLRNDIIERGIPSERLFVVPNAVDMATLSEPIAKDKELVEKFDSNMCQILGFIGSFYAYEGLDLLIEALPAVKAVHPETKVMLVGGGPEEGRLREQVKSAGLDRDVIFTGRVPHHDVARYYSLIDIFVYPRRSMRLTELVTPLKPLEAMAQGKPVLASDIGGHRELIRDGVTGQLFKAGDVREIAERINISISSPDRINEMVQNALDHVHRERTWISNIIRYQRHYEKLVASGHST